VKIIKQIEPPDFRVGSETFFIVGMSDREWQSLAYILGQVGGDRIPEELDVHQANKTIRHLRDAKKHLAQMQAELEKY
jgi:hypothetical protein